MTQKMLRMSWLEMQCTCERKEDTAQIWYLRAFPAMPLLWGNPNPDWSSFLTAASRYKTTDTKLSRHLALVNKLFKSTGDVPGTHSDHSFQAQSSPSSYQSNIHVVTHTIDGRYRGVRFRVKRVVSREGTPSRPSGTGACGCRDAPPVCANLEVFSAWRIHVTDPIARFDARCAINMCTS